MIRNRLQNLFTIFILLTSSLIFSQELKFEEVVKVDSTITKDELFNRARTWAAQNFNSTKNQITIEDSKLGEISGIGLYDYRADKKYMGYSCVEGPITYKFSIYLKDGRYKYDFNSFDHKGSRGPGCRPVDYGRLTLVEKAPIKGKMIADDYAWWDVKEKTNVKIESLISQLNENMNKKHEISKDW